MGRPNATRRDKVYAALKAAGERGVTDAEMRAAAPLPGMHIPSLIAEGHSIASRAGERDGPGAVWVWVLVKDAWE